MARCVIAVVGDAPCQCFTCGMKYCAEPFVATCAPFRMISIVWGVSADGFSADCVCEAPQTTTSTPRKAKNIVFTSRTSRRLTADQLLVGFRITRPFDLESGCCALDGREIFGTQRNLDCAEVFVEPGELRRSGYRHDPGFLR